MPGSKKRNLKKCWPIGLTGRKDKQNDIQNVLVHYRVSNVNKKRKERVSQILKRENQRVLRKRKGRKMVKYEVSNCMPKKLRLPNSYMEK